MSIFPAPITSKLRILQTTDLHMQLLDYDYFADRPDTSIGLVGLVDQIATLRATKDVTTLLCDTGDLLQGNPLADTLMRDCDQSGPHPMIAAMNMLEYNAMTIGNHDGDYGYDALRRVLADAQCAIVSANLATKDPAVLARSHVILSREMRCDDGIRRPIKIGITGFGPPHPAHSQSADLTTALHFTDIVAAAKHAVAKMRTAGADVIVALCHSGIGEKYHAPRMENAALPLAAIPGIDIILMGHTHGVFPDQTCPASSVIDYPRGRLHDKPAVMAGFGGSALGVVDLDLRWQAHHWQITGSTVRLVSAQGGSAPESPLRRRIRALVARPHVATLSQMRRPIAQTATPIHSYFATVQPDLSQQILARALQRAIATAVEGTEYEAHPVLAAKSSFRSGGRSGFGHYIDIPVGPITAHDVAGITPFADRCCAVRRTGHQIRLWLERSAAHYQQIALGQSDQLLINPESLGYNCDTIHGLSYQIDLTQPARFDPHGHEIDPTARRITHLRHNEEPVRDSQQFLVATNSFRAQGGGHFPPIARDDILYTSTQSTKALLIAYLKSAGTWRDPVRQTWSFSPIDRATALFVSAPEAARFAKAPIKAIGRAANGAGLYRLTF